MSSFYSKKTVMEEVGNTNTLKFFDTWCVILDFEQNCLETLVRFIANES